MEALATLSEKLTSRISVESSGCWTWTGARDRDGYGKTGNGRMAHRVVYESMVGPIPVGLQIDHLCRNHPCVRPDHLEPVTPRENHMRGLAARGPAQACAKGHAFTDENTLVRRGERRCLLCYKRTRVRSIVRAALQQNVLEPAEMRELGNELLLAANAVEAGERA